MSTLDLPPRISDSLLMRVYAHRMLAHLVVDDNQMLLQVGGHLAHYGVAGLKPGSAATDQLPLLEGLLPLVETPFLNLKVTTPSDLALA